MFEFEGSAVGYYDSSKERDVKFRWKSIRNLQFFQLIVKMFGHCCVNFGDLGEQKFYFVRLFGDSLGGRG